MKRIGVLTSGGDTPGMNAAIRAVLKVGNAMGYHVMGIYHGYAGLMAGRVHSLTATDVDNIVHKGGTILRTSRSDEFRSEEGQKKALQIIEAYQMDGIVVIGGDGSFMGAQRLAELGVPTAALPGTIDNDLGYTDFTIGFDTAVNSVMGEVYKIRDTMRSHDRVGIVEVMGRHCGDIALYAGIGAGADLILVPEYEMPWEQALEKLVSNKLKGRLTSIVLIAEGAGKAEDLADYINTHSDVDSKAIVLGYTQRGGNPTATDRMLASRMGHRAVELLASGQTNRAVGIRDNQIIDMEIVKAVKMPRIFQRQILELNEILERF